MDVRCQECGEPLREGQRFCGGCGAPRPLPSASTRRVERRVCTVLFCDLVEFTPIAERRDPEAVRELLSAYFAAARKVLDAHGGTVEKFIGDAVVSVWGAPVAREDDAERAVRAALALIGAVEALRPEVGVPDLGARIGVVTGEVAVVTGAVGEGLVAGDTVNTAARIQGAAEPGSVLIDDLTARLVGTSMDLRDAGDRVLKGKSRTEHVWHVDRTRAALGRSRRSDGLQAPMIGRERELDEAERRLRSTVAAERPQMVIVSGEAGAGKTRLGRELERCVGAEPDRFRWFRTSCPAYGDGIAFRALADLIRDSLGIAEGTRSDIAQDLLLAGVRGVVADAGERTVVGVGLARLLALAHSADDGRELERIELFDGWRTWLERLADAAPLVWVVEDLEAADSGLLDFLEHLLTRSTRARIHVIGNARPEFVRDHRSWAEGRGRSRLDLRPLGAASIESLLEALVPSMPPRISRVISDRARGVPLFALETVRALIDQDVIARVEGRYRLVGAVGELVVPDSLRALLAARLDLLEPSARDLLASAGVLGETFTEPALADVAERPSTSVRSDLDLLLERDLLAVRDETWAFSHDLVRRVAVETLSRRERRTRHLRVVDHLRRVSAGSGEEVADSIARHLLGALDAVPESADAEVIRAEAVHELVRGAERADRLGAPRRAAEDFAEAAVREPRAHRSAELLTRAASARLGASDWDLVRQLSDRARSQFLELGDDRSAAAAEALAGVALYEAGRYEEARSNLEGALLVLERRPDVSTLRAARALGETAVFAGADDARQLVERAVALGERLAAPSGDMAELLNLLSIARSVAGERTAAIDAAREAARLALEAGRWSAVSMAHALMADDLIGERPAEAAEHATIALDSARRVGYRNGIALAVENLTCALISLGRWREAHETLEEVRRRDDIEEFGFTHVAAGRTAGYRGDDEGLEQARKDLDALGSDNPEWRCYSASFDLHRLPADASPADVIAAADGVLSFAGALNIDWEPIRFAWVCAARAADRSDDPAAARILALPQRARADELGAEFRAEIRLAEARRNPVPERAFPDAIAAQRATSGPHLLAHGLLDWAEHRLASGRGGDAGELIDEAVAIAERLGASRILDRAELVRRRLAREVRPRALAPGSDATGPDRPADPER